MSSIDRSNRLFLLAMAVFMVLATSVVPSTVAAQEGEVQRTEAEIADMALALQIKYMSPYCPGANLRDCTSGKAAVLREEIKGWVAAGWTEKAITDELVSRYGETILSAPRFKGFNVLVWIFPIVAVVIGLGLILFFLQQQKTMKMADHVKAEVEVDEDYQAESHLQDELERELSARSR